MFSNVKVPDINTEEKETTPSTVTFESGEASNISFKRSHHLTSIDDCIISKIFDA